MPPATVRSPADTASTPHTPDFVISEGGRSAPTSNLFSTEDGTIAGFNAAVVPSNAVIAVDQSAAAAVYKRLAMAGTGGANYL